VGILVPCLGGCCYYEPCGWVCGYFEEYIQFGWGKEGRELVEWTCEDGGCYRSQGLLMDFDMIGLLLWAITKTFVGLLKYCTTGYSRIFTKRIIIYITRGK